LLRLGPEEITAAPTEEKITAASGKTPDNMKQEKTEIIIYDNS